jgi:hypothetical protein
MANSLLRVLIVVSLSCALLWVSLPTRAGGGDDLPSDAAKRIKQFDGDVQGIHK